MKVYLGADHAGFELKNQIREHLFHRGVEVEDLGAETLQPEDDYPGYAYEVVTKVLGEEKDEGRGILVCGSGQGVCMAANRVGGIRAALVWSQEMARETRRDNDSNVLCLASRFTDEATALSIVDNWLDEKFSGEERHRRRIQQIEELYG
jgi:ribose 5-phosphate isomerase B